MAYLSCRYLAKLYFFWLLFFIVNRIVFLCVQLGELHRIAFQKIAVAFYYALPLDSSAACYSLVLPFIVLWVIYWVRKRAVLRILKIVVIVFIFLHCFVAYGEAALYTQWHSKLSWDALSHFLHPSEVFKTASWGLTILFFGTTVIFGGLFTFLYIRFVHIKKLPASNGRKNWVWSGIAVYLIAGFVVFTGIRGGWRRFPIGLSIAYYSQESVLNDAAVNPSWNLIHNLSVVAKEGTKNPYIRMPDAKASKIVDSLFNFRKDTSVSVLTTTRPNIVLFILESWPADIVNAPHKPEIMPIFDRLLQKGIYFDHCYPTGFVSDEGIPGILSAFPTSGNVSVLSRPSKTILLPAINGEMDSVGYHSGFIYGGMLDFGNIQGYIYNKHFNVVKSERDFSDAPEHTALGVPDAVMAPRVVSLIDKAQQPFFYCWYTLSTHPPFDIPTPKWIKYGGEQQDFVNTLHYADSSLGIFFKKARTKPWYKNTLFVFVSDHSHDSQYKRPVQHKDRNRIPLLFFGDVIKPNWQGKVIHKVTSQLDIAATLLAQLKLSHDRYPWSKNAFNPYAPHFAAYNYLTGSGFITKEGFVAQDNRFHKFLMTNLKDSSKIKKMIRLNQAFEQKAYDYFLKW